MLRKPDTIWKRKKLLKADPLSMVFSIIAYKKYILAGEVLYVVLSQITCGFGFYLLLSNRDWYSLKRELPSFVILESLVEFMTFHIAYCMYYTNLQKILFENCWDIASAGEEARQRILKDSKLVKRYSILVISLSLVCTLSYLPITGGDPETYMYLYYPKRTWGRWYLLVNMCVLFFIPHIALFTVFPTNRIAYTATHLRYQYLLLNENLLAISQGLNPTDVRYQDIIYERLRVCIKHHNTIKRLGRLIHKDMDSFVLVTPMAAVPSFVAAVLFIYLGVDPSSNIRMYSLLVIWFASLFKVSIHCQLLTDEADKLFYTLYSCPWTEWNKKNRLALLNMLTISRKSEVVNGLNVVNIDCTFILKVCKATYSMLTLFLQLNNK